MTNLFDTRRFPATAFGDLYHRRWRIEQAFTRLKHRLHLELASGLSQQAVVQDVAAKITCDNLQTLASLTAHEQAALREVDRISTPNDACGRAFRACARGDNAGALPMVLLGGEKFVSNRLLP